MPISDVLVADDRPLVRLGIRTLLGERYPMTAVREADSYDGARRKIGQLRPSVLVLDLTLPDVPGLAALRDARHRDPGLPILALGRREDPQLAASALQAGASGFWAPQNTVQDFLSAVEALARGETYCPESIRLRLLTQDPLNDISERELEVLRALGRGRTLTEISLAIGLSIKTVSTYRARLIKKLGLKNQAELVVFAHSHFS